MNFRLTATGAVPAPPPRRWTGSGALDDARLAGRVVHFEGEPRRVAVYARERLPGNAALAGPAIVEEMGATTIVPPGWTASVGDWGELMLQRRSL